MNYFGPEGLYGIIRLAQAMPGSVIEQSAKDPNFMRISFLSEHNGNSRLARSTTLDRIIRKSARLEPNLHILYRAY